MLSLARHPDDCEENGQIGSTKGAATKHLLLRPSAERHGRQSFFRALYRVNCVSKQRKLIRSGPKDSHCCRYARQSLVWCHKHRANCCGSQLIENDDTWWAAGGISASKQSANLLGHAPNVGRRVRVCCVENKRHTKSNKTICRKLLLLAQFSGQPD